MSVGAGPKYKALGPDLMNPIGSNFENSGRPPNFENSSYILILSLSSTRAKSIFHVVGNIRAILQQFLNICVSYSLYTS